MDDLSKDSAAPLDTHSTLEPSPGPIHEFSELSPPPPAPPQAPASLPGWETIDERRGFCDEQDALHPNYNLACRKLQNRGKDEVVIFDYSLAQGSLSGVDENLTVEGGGASSEPFSADEDIFLRVPKKLIRSKPFDEIINPTKEPRLIPSRGARLHIM